jgi:hypothetical protein
MSEGDGPGNPQGPGADRAGRERVDVDPGDAAWAHNRWPTVGLFSGAGLGLVLGLLYQLGWILTTVSVIALAVGGCLGGLALAKFVYRDADRRPD